VPEQQHIIGRMEVQVNASQPLLATQLQQQLGYRLHTADFSRQLAALLDGLVGENEYIEIPALSISLECTDETDFHLQLLSQLSAAIKEQLTAQQSDSIILPNSSAYTEMLQLFFLKYGIRAFYNGGDMITAFQADLKALADREQPELEQLLKKAGKADAVVWTRLYYLLGAAGMKKFFLRTFGCNEAALQALMQQTFVRTGATMPFTGSTPTAAGTASTDSPDTLLPDANQWPVLFQYMLAGNEMPLFVSTVTNTGKNVTSPGSVTAASAAPPEAIAVSLAAQLQRGLQIENAGLVLLWMECGRLFRTLGYVVDRQFVDEIAQQRAILLLHYICYGKGGAGGESPASGGKSTSDKGGASGEEATNDTGDTSGEENTNGNDGANDKGGAGGEENTNSNDVTGGEENWLLNKLLCDWPLHMPVDPALAPDQAAQEAAEEMLIAYLEAWRKDRKFSAGWFSTAFLQREGQLSRRNDGAWILTVNARTEDIIINKVSMVKYAWMPQILYVQW
jgi:hypothetical protein